ncbi:hypothetical protein CEXT_738081 [Caerostris extrusa]|uniref:Uncharacterized protein n=1 Tax=Caerostris extrusa TaxID=172846 RepID=A0AAV4TEA9_CAEEX|nr:hypothetical protein CEXT_738081 [Caerostris extrusa]
MNIPSRCEGSHREGQSVVRARINEGSKGVPMSSHETMSMNSHYVMNDVYEFGACIAFSFETWRPNGDCGGEREECRTDR